jgi:solute carrier family 25 (adenine nucleotide translocator) protein 4/5/6/31
MYAGYGLGLSEVLLSKFINNHGKKSIKKGSKNHDGLSLKSVLIQLTTTLLCYPLSTIRRILMVDATRVNREYNGVIDCFRKIKRDEGLSGFFKGFALAALTGTLGYVSSIMLKKLLNQKPVEVKKLKPIEESINGNGFVDL